MATYLKPRVRGAAKPEPIRDLMIGMGAEGFSLRFRVGAGEDWQSMPVGALLLTRTDAQRIVEAWTRTLGKESNAKV